MPSSVPNFNFSTVFVSEIKRGSQNFMWYCWPPAVPRTLILLCVLQVLGKIKRPAKFLHRSSMHRVVMWIRICHRLSIICTQKLCFGGFLGWKCQSTVFWPQKKACLITRQLAYCMSKSVQRTLTCTMQHFHELYLFTNNIFKMSSSHTKTFCNMI